MLLYESGLRCEMGGKWETLDQLIAGGGKVKLG